MEKKTKNIIAIAIILILVIGIFLTIHFSKNDNQLNRFTEVNAPVFNGVLKDNSVHKNRDNLKDKRVFPADKDSMLEEDDDDELETSEFKFSDDDDDDDFETSESLIEGHVFDNRSFSQLPNNSISGIYVVLLCIESFLLGGTIMYLVMNNINNSQIVIEEKTRKTKK